jgi:hypothetical protein
METAKMNSVQYDTKALESALTKLRECAGVDDVHTFVRVSSPEAAALLAKIEAADRLEWQPIETAPKDGAEFQAWLLDAGRQHGWWEPRCRFNDDGAFQVWQRVDYDDDGWDVIEARPTHWLPEPTEPPAYRNPQPAGDKA